MPGPLTDQYIPEQQVDAALPGWRLNLWAPPPKPVEPPPEKRPNLFEAVGNVLGRPQQAAFELIPGQGGPGAAYQQLVGGTFLPGAGPAPEQRGFEQRFLQGLPEGAPRSVLGFAGDVVEDPMNFIPFGLIGKAAKGRKLFEASAAAAEAARVGPELIKPVSFGSALQGIETPGRVGQAVRDVANEPWAGPMRALADRLAPTVAAEDPLRQKLFGFERATASASQSARANVLAVQQQMGPWKTLDADGRLALQDGTRVAYADIPEKGLLGQLDAETAQRLGAHQALFRQAFALRDEAIEALRPLAPEVAHNFEVLSEVPLPTGGAYSPRVLLKEGTKLGGLGGLQKGTYEFEREFPTMEQGLEAIAKGTLAGRYLGPDEVLRVGLEALAKDTALIQFTTAVMQDARIPKAVRDYQGITDLAAGAKTAAEQSDVAKEVGVLLRQVLQQRRLPWQQLEKIRQANPEIGAKLDAALAIDIKDLDPVRAAKAGITAMLSGSRVTRERFITDLNQVREALRIKKGLPPPEVKAAKAPKPSKPAEPPALPTVEGLDVAGHTPEEIQRLRAVFNAPEAAGVLSEVAQALADTPILKGKGSLDDKAGAAFNRASQAYDDLPPGVDTEELDNLTSELENFTQDAYPSVKEAKDALQEIWDSVVEEFDRLVRSAPEVVEAAAAEPVGSALGAAPKAMRRPPLLLKGLIGPGELSQVLQDLHGENYKYAGELRRLFEYSLRGQIAQRKEALMAVGRETRAWVKETGLAKMDAANASTAAIAAGKAATGGAGFAPTRFKRLAGVWLQPEDVTRLENAIEPKAHPGLSWLASGPAASRAILTTMDLGAWAYQGLVRLASNPRDTLYGMYRMSLAALDPATHPKYLGLPANQEAMRRMPDLAVLGGGMGENEIFQAAPQMADWFRTHLGRAGKVAASIFDRGQASFEALGDTVRLEWAKSVLPTAERAGKVKEMAAVINHGTGVMAPRVGISLNQKAVEQMLVFAPNYTRSAFALVGDMLQGGVAGQEARETVARMLVVGAFMYNKAATMLGQDPVLDPSDSRFMTLQLPGTEERVGIGGVWVALARLASRSVTNKYTGELDVSQLLKLDGDNPLVRFFRGRQPVGVGTFFDLSMNESYDDLPLDQLPGLSFHIGASFLPMAVQGYWIEAGRHASGQGGRLGLGELGLQTGATLAGLNRPERSIQDVMDSVANEKFRRPYEELLPHEQGQVRASPEVKRLPPPMGPRGERARGLDSAFAAQGEVLTKAAAQVDAGQMTKGQFRDIAAEESIKLGARLEDVEKRSPSKVPTTDPRELARKQYFEFLRNVDLGDLRFEQADEFYNSLPLGYQGYIDDRQLGAAQLVGGRAAALMTELIQARRALKPYWEVRTQVLDQMGLKATVLRLDPAQKEQFEASRLGLQVRQRTDNIRQRMRRQEPQLDALLVEWGYVKQDIRGRMRRPLPPAPIQALR